MNWKRNYHFIFYLMGSNTIGMQATNELPIKPYEFNTGIFHPTIIFTEPLASHKGLAFNMPGYFRDMLKWEKVKYVFFETHEPDYVLIKEAIIERDAK